MPDLRRNPFRIPEGVDRVLSVRPRWLGTQQQMQAGYMVVRIWHDGRVEDVAGPTDRPAALSLARTQARIERTVYLRAPDDLPLDQPGPVFGDVAGVRPGARFHRREDLRRAGLHRRTQQGIDWTSEGALAVVFSGGYADDEWSEDDPWYTGEGGQDAPGGRQVRDQELTGGNLALERSYRAGVPVRVIRKVPAGSDYEYLYEGLYHVVDTHHGPSRDGPKVYRFRLRRTSA
jgi:SAD/SRA domain